MPVTVNTATETASLEQRIQNLEAASAEQADLIIRIVADLSRVHARLEATP